MKKIAIGSDMKANVPESVVKLLEKKGYQVDLFGALDPEAETHDWPKVGIEVAQLVGMGVYPSAILFCWTGTGICMAANKVAGIRAALCQDAQTAAGARKWNDANILCMSIRATTEAIAEEMIDAWESHVPSDSIENQRCLKFLADWEHHHKA
ncbi:RpiB/LacA/LacB family sugar-phosphate isomerase [Pontibacter sp. G13]|uniref:RpiB/LacA/LacB family sugar-phosphate isomerase n=1 Tax=Pontibacter sp. G13 TaxID=3074898 RepID=UPI00288B1B92|nr:RpiB/LacA/LacB family sugar-phosphate isomerase [Pontibacter sp. G13]WNJ19011.1 RpiB/LacA/LacB family sugar-phosphate isomerase [Pontibacter sp. G13]